MKRLWKTPNSAIGSASIKSLSRVAMSCMVALLFALPALSAGPIPLLPAPARQISPERQHCRRRWQSACRATMRGRVCRTRPGRGHQASVPTPVPEPPASESSWCAQVRRRVKPCWQSAASHSMRPWRLKAMCWRLSPRSICHSRNRRGGVLRRADDETVTTPAGAKPLLPTGTVRGLAGHEIPRHR